MAEELGQYGVCDFGSFGIYWGFFYGLIHGLLFWIFFPHVLENMQEKDGVFFFFPFFPSLSLYIMLSKDLKIQKVQLINSRCINICTYYIYMHTYHIHQCLSPAGTCGTLKHQWPRISTEKGRQSLFKSISGKNWDQNFEIFPPTWPLSDTAASITQARITYTHSHIKTGFSQSFQSFITVFCSYFMEATSLWLVHFFNSFSKVGFGRKERAACIILLFWHSADQRNVFT